MFLGLHNHDNLSDPDALNTEASFVTGLAFSPDVKATLDVRHFTAATETASDFSNGTTRGRRASISGIGGDTTAAAHRSAKAMRRSSSCFG